MKIRTYLAGLLLMLTLFTSAVAFSADKPYERKFKIETVHAKSFNWDQKAEIKAFILTAGKEILATGWKYYQISNMVITKDKLHVEVQGTNDPQPWNGCGPIAWQGPQPYPPSNLVTAVTLVKESYETQFNCVCVTYSEHPECDNEWCGYRYCATVTATNGACDCL